MTAASESLSELVRSGRYVDVLTSGAARPLVGDFVRCLLHGGPPARGVADGATSSAVALAALDAFLQVNVTGPVLHGAAKWLDEALLPAARALRGQEESSRPQQGAEGGLDLALVRSKCSASLEADGSSPYLYIPHIELFALARHVVGGLSDGEWTDAAAVAAVSLGWMKLRLSVWHFKLFVHPTLHVGNAFNKAPGSEVPSLVEEMQARLDAVEKDVNGEAWGAESSRWSADDKVRFLVEKANLCVMLGLNTSADDALRDAAHLHGFAYALSGALGKRTRFQDRSTSQLVVLAKSAVAQTDGGAQNVPEALPLHDDTLLENIEYASGNRGLQGQEKNSGGEDARLPAALQGLAPNGQPQLSPLDQIILLTEATLKDAFPPVDSLTAEEVLPFAVRVIDDKTTNWQIYTQALLVRSRIEVHRSRTVERGVLQMQAVVDQVIVDTTQVPEPDVNARAHTGAKHDSEDNAGVPAIQVSVPGEKESAPPKKASAEAAAADKKPTSFFAAPKSTESAPAQVRLEYIHALSSPPRWHLESELAYSWTSVGSLVSALDIFKRLRLWAEVALCLASNAAAAEQDGSGRGSGGEEKARAILRWRLFHRKAALESVTDAPEAGGDDEALDENTDVSALKAADFTGPERTPPQPNAPRLFCILGDMEPQNALDHYERAWEISKHRYSRAQKSIGEYYLAERNWSKARDAYQKAVAANRLSPEMWNRLGDINLRIGRFEDAAESFTRAIGSSNATEGGEDARTWSNLGSALYSLYCAKVKEAGDDQQNGDADHGDSAAAMKAARLDDEDDEDEEGDDIVDGQDDKSRPTDTSVLLARAMNAYKRGASIAHDNWRIWENVMTLAVWMQPVPWFEVIQALRAVIRIRGTEDALDENLVKMMLNDTVLSAEKKSDSGAGVYGPPRGSVEWNVVEVVETEVVPLITRRSELWEVVSRLRAWRRDYAGAVDASEKAWRAAVGGAVSGGAVSGGGSMGGGLTVANPAKSDGRGAAAARNWLEDEDGWNVVVQRTRELVAALEQYGPEVIEIGPRWKGKARSATRSVMGKAREYWEGCEGWQSLQALLDGLKA